MTTFGICLEKMILILENLCKAIVVFGLSVLFGGIIYEFMFVDRHDPKYLNSRYCSNSGITELKTDGLGVHLLCKNGAKFEIANRDL